MRTINYISNEDKTKFINNLKNGDRIKVTRDLSTKENQTDMISTFTMLYSNRTAKIIREQIHSHRIVELEKLSEWY